MRTIAALLLLSLGVAPAAPAFADGDHDVVHVRPGQSIQRAVERAEPGDTVIVEPGRYREAGSRCERRETTGGGSCWRTREARPRASRSPSPAHRGLPV